MDYSNGNFNNGGNWIQPSSSSSSSSDPQLPTAGAEPDWHIAPGVPAGAAAATAVPRLVYPVNGASDTKLKGDPVSGSVITATIIDKSQNTFTVTRDGILIVYLNSYLQTIVSNTICSIDLQIYKNGSACLDDENRKMFFQNEGTGAATDHHTRSTMKTLEVSNNDEIKIEVILSLYKTSNTSNEVIAFGDYAHDSTSYKKFVEVFAVIL